jgi:hypothetical protein
MTAMNYPAVANKLRGQGAWRSMPSNALKSFDEGIGRLELQQIRFSSCLLHLRAAPTETEVNNVSRSYLADFVVLELRDPELWREVGDGVTASGS